jgi:hypothetical protein
MIIKNINKIILILFVHFALTSSAFAFVNKKFEMCKLWEAEKDYFDTFTFDLDTNEVEQTFFATGSEYISFRKIIKNDKYKLKTEIFPYGNKGSYAQYVFDKVRNEVTFFVFSDPDGTIRENRYKLTCENIEGTWKNLAEDNVFTKNDFTIETDENYYALIIGNNNYDHLIDLDAAINDATVLSKVLEKKYGFEVELLTNANYDTTVNALHNISKKLTNSDNLLIFYAGHGELDKKQNRGYWLPVDASYDFRSKWISNAIIADELKATEAKHVLLIVDSCFSGSLMRSSGISNDSIMDKDYVDLLKKKKTRLVITSGGNEPVIDSDGGDHSIFARKLIDSLNDNNEIMSTQQLFEKIRKYVAVNANQTPERAAIYQAGHDGGDFLFFSKK